MIEYETKTPQFTSDRAAVYEFAKKYRVGVDDAERIYLKIGALATEEQFLAEAKLPASKMTTSIDKVADARCAPCRILSRTTPTRSELRFDFSNEHQTR
ncbi:hypothetical protein GAO09_04730 [Rhizobiales bacterium RZME27]|uniref:Uncharacterized protein n=1 Tax=Endobacterium cereale TaxID=2663029 RepID=A0A6A8A6V3_9HYPH|nr:hypothetical protein [Endobacterium cereale]MEB2846497.1 hypothetical protein [Endobacterium cereale]MQY45370.1 hypothetical protein [Endobacterium cereale]